MLGLTLTVIIGILPRLWSSEHAGNYMNFTGPLEFSIAPEYRSNQMLVSRVTLEMKFEREWCQGMIIINFLEQSPYLEIQNPAFWVRYSFYFNTKLAICIGGILCGILLEGRTILPEHMTLWMEIGLVGLIWQFTPGESIWDLRRGKITKPETPISFYLFIGINRLIFSISTRSETFLGALTFFPFHRISTENLFKRTSFWTKRKRLCFGWFFLRICHLDWDGCFCTCA